MEGLYFRKKEKSSNAEEETEFLDEQGFFLSVKEQEKLLQELREQNDVANQNIQIGLVVIGLLVAALFGSVLLQRTNIPTIPIADIFGSTPSLLDSPTFAVICSLTSVVLAILTLLSFSGVKTIAIPRLPIKFTGSAAFVVGLISPFMSLFSHTTYIELFFWSIPIILMMMYYFAIHMINQVYRGLDELEGSKYKYKDPIDEKAMLNKDWKCPQHDGRSYARRHKLIKKHGQIIKVDQPKEDLTFPEADKVVDYGGIIHNLKSSEIESDFLNYARKYRNHQSLCSARGQIELEEANEWLESLQTFQLQDIPHFRNDGIQMLLDAANMDDSLSMSSQSTMPEEVVIIDHLSYERYQAIEELIQLKDVQTCSDILPPFQLVKSIELEYNDHYVFDVSANSQYAITSASDNLVRLYDLRTLQVSYTIPAHQERISKIKLKSDQYLFTASEDQTLKRWDLRAAGSTGPVQTFKYIKPLTAFDLNYNDTMAIAGTEFSTSTQSADLAFFDTRTASLLHTFDESHGDDVTEIQCHPTLRTQFISCSTDGLLNNYDVTEFDEEEAMISVVNPGSSVNKAGYFGPNAEYLYCLTHVETFSLHTLEGDRICNFGDIRSIGSTPVDYAIDCSYDPIAQRFYLITGDNSGTVDFFHVNIGQLQHCQQLRVTGGHSDVVRSLYWHHPTQSILSGGEDGRLCAWQGQA
ncbi:hypothetical protein [Parasitella parasitica]|uniref:WD40 repeat-like protein n=1 Tax=Parasitella parasitica TaxID=35722 RepID=A0A0B7MX36_9FUNG|nr:hypothetical protein [Parasitella parasitica]